MSHDYVDVARHNMTLGLESSLEALSLPGEAVAEHFSVVSLCYRVLALCSLLHDADVEEFTTRLCKAGQARLAFLNMATDNHSFDRKFLVASDSVGFSDALAAGDLETARAIARLSLDEYTNGLEYEEDFLFTRFLHLMAREPQDDDALARILKRWSRLAEGDFDAKLETCHALWKREESQFETAFKAIIDERKQDFKEYRRQLDFEPQVGATTGQIYVDGLAILRLAELEGLSTRGAYAMIPALARVPLGASLPPQDSWRLGV